MRLIEESFPLIEVNAISEYEMSFKITPRRIAEELRRITSVPHARADSRIKIKINSLFYYPARIPPSATRAVVLASAIENAPTREFLKAIGMDNLIKFAQATNKFPTLFMVDPERDLVKKLLGKDPGEITVVDPMAGGGSIPLEAKRLGFTVIAGDYNPLAYLLLRATIEFPAKYGEKLYKLVSEEARGLLAYVERELGRFYSREDKGYIFFFSAKHDCGGTLPLIKEHALSKSKGVFISWDVDGNGRRLRFKVSREPPPRLRVCPFCGRPVSEMLLRQKWIEKHKEIIERLLSGDEGAADEVPLVYALAAVQVSGSRFREPGPDDERRLVEAARELARAAREGDLAEYLPIFEIPEDNKVFEEVRESGLDFWHLLFSPRQLLVMYKVGRYIRRRGEELRKLYGELGVAVALYLALGFAKAVNYNSISTQWHSARTAIRDLVGSQYALGREVGLGYDFAEGNAPFVNLPWAFEAEEEDEEGEAEETTGGLLPVLRLLCKSLEGMWREGRDAIYLWDARELDKYLPPGSVDLINVDPPYYDQHDYAGISEFFWAVLQAVLGPLLQDLFPRDRVKVNWEPYDPMIPRGIEIRGEPPSRPGEVSGFGENFSKFLRAASRVLKPEGLLVVWYSYGRLEGWEELFYRFYEAGYSVTKTWQVWTQSPQRRIALHAKAFFTSMVIVARPNARRSVVLDAKDPRIMEEVSRRVRSSFLGIISVYGLEHLVEALVVSVADGYAAATLFEIPSEDSLTKAYNYYRLVSVALTASFNAILEEMARKVHEKFSISAIDPVSRLYLLLLVAASADEGDRLKVPHEFVNKASQVLGVNPRAVVVQSRERTTDLLLPPSEIAKRSYAVSDALGLVYGIIERLAKTGFKSAEAFASEKSTSAPLALFLVEWAWDKIGPKGLYTSVPKDKVREVLLKVITW